MFQRVGAISLGANGFQALYFGPFPDGSLIDELTLSAQASAVVSLRIGFFGSRGPSTAAGFASDGDFFSASAVAIASGVIRGDYPIWEHTPVGPRNYVGVGITTGVGGSFTGSAWLKVRPPGGGWVRLSSEQRVT